MVTIDKLRRSDSREHKALAAALKAEGHTGPVPAALLFQRLPPQQASYALERCGRTDEDAEWCWAFAAVVKARGRAMVPAVSMSTAELGEAFDGADPLKHQGLVRKARLIAAAAELATARLSDLGDVCTCASLLANAIAQWKGGSGRGAMELTAATIQAMARDCAAIAGTA